MKNLESEKMKLLINELLKNNQYTRGMYITWNRLADAIESNDDKKANHELMIFHDLLKANKLAVSLAFKYKVQIG